MPPIYNSKKLIIFDLDGTLAESKSNLDAEMSALLFELLKKKLVAIISGGSFLQFEKQFLQRFSYSELILANLYLLPTSGAQFYIYKNNKWLLEYAHNLTEQEKSKIFDAFNNVFIELNYAHPQKIYGEVFEDRGTQITFSALGQKAPIFEKEAWSKNSETVRLRIKEGLERRLPEFEVRLGGLTSTDVTRKGIDKAYGIRQIEKLLNIPKEDMLFVGDAIYEGGNDYPVVREDVFSIPVQGPHDTKKIIQSMLQI